MAKKSMLGGNDDIWKDFKNVALLFLFISFFCMVSGSLYKPEQKKSELNIFYKSAIIFIILSIICAFSVIWYHP